MSNLEPISEHFAKVDCTLFKAAFSRLWYDLAKSPARTVRWLSVAPFAFRLLRTVVDLIEFVPLPRNLQHKVVSSAVSALVEIDFVDLIGRLILLPTLLKVVPRELGSDQMIIEGSSA